MVAEKTVSQSRTQIDHFVRSTHMNGTGRLYGGTLLQWIDDAAGITAFRHAGHLCSTAAIDNLQFREGVPEASVVVCIGTVTWVGTTSMEVKVESYREDADGSRKLINTAYVVYVALDENGRPIPVPQLKLETEEERAEWEKAAKRNALRRERRKEGY